MPLPPSRSTARTGPARNPGAGGSRQELAVFRGIQDAELLKGAFQAHLWHGGADQSYRHEPTGSSPAWGFDDQVRDRPGQRIDHELVQHAARAVLAGDGRTDRVQLGLGHENNPRGLGSWLTNTFLTSW